VRVRSTTAAVPSRNVLPTDSNSITLKLHRSRGHKNPSRQG
jgi:hypothetical protein